MKKLILLNLILLLMTGIINAQTAIPPTTGNGTSGNPYQIASLENLYWITVNSTAWDKYFVQTANIDASATSGWSTGGWLPISNTWDNSFSGNYNGNNKTISGLYIPDSPSSDVFGLFGYAAGATFQNIGLLNVHINGVHGSAGGLVGYAEGVTTNNCYSSGSVIADISGEMEAGGLVGYFSMSSAMFNCFSSCDVSGAYAVGGLVGINDKSTISNSHYLAGTVVSLSDVNTYAGGLVGANQGGIISKCYGTGTVNGFDYTGGLAGINSWGGQISNSFSRCTCSNDPAWGPYGGGLAGANWLNSTITNCYSPGKVTSTLMGGLVGADIGSTLNSFWNSDVAESGTDWSNSGTEISTNEMKTQSTFTNVGWDFTTIWGMDADINDGYPFLIPVSICTDGTIALTSGSETQTVCAGTAITPIVYTIGGGATGAAVSPALPTGLSGVYNGDTKNYTISGKSTVYGTFNFNVETTGSSPCTEATAEGTITVFGYSGGEGTELDPFQIATLADLQFLSENDCHWDKYFIQTAKIDASDTKNWNNGEGFSPIGYYGNSFTGSYFGQGYDIIGLTINRPDPASGNSQGMFGATNGAVLAGIGLWNVNIYTISGGSVGGLVGDARSSRIDESFVTGEVKGSGYVGGLVGQLMDNSDISDSYATCEVFGTTDHVGGLVGSSYNTSLIYDCYATGQVTGKDRVGGLVGQNGDADLSTIRNCYAAGLVVGNTNTGGLVGYNNGGEVINCFWDTQTTGQVSSSGGTGKSTQEMKTWTTFSSAGWDIIELWGIYVSCPDWSYPYLSVNWQKPEPGREENHNPTSGGEISGNQSICSGSDPDAFSSVTGASGYIGILEYKWQYSDANDPYDWEDLSESNSAEYDDNQTSISNRWYRRLARVTCSYDWTGAAESNVLELTVILSPNVSITGNNSPICYDKDAEFYLQGTPGAEVTYSFDGGETTNTVTLVGGTATVTDMEATSNVTLSLISICNQTLTTTSTVTVNSPTASISGDHIACTSTTLTAVSNASNPTYVWTTVNGEDWVPEGVGSTLVVTKPGNYYLWVKDGVTGCERQSDPFAVEFIPEPEVSIISNNSPICYDKDAEFYLEGTPGAEVTYSFDGGTTTRTVSLIGGSATVIAMEATSDVTLSLVSIKINSTGCNIALTSTSTVTVNEPPTASISGAHFACTSTTLTAETNASNPTYYWGTVNDEGWVQEGEGSTFEVKKSGNYYLAVVDGITECDRVSDAFEVTINSAPEVQITPALSEITQGGTVELTASGADSYSWSSVPAGFSSTDAVIRVSPVKNTTYIVTGTSNGCSSSDEAIIYVQETCKNSADQYEPNNSMSGNLFTIPIDLTIGANLLNAKDPDWYRLDIGSLAKYSLKLTKTGTVNPSVELYGSNGRKLKSIDRTQPNSYNLAIGIYYIKVSAGVKSYLCYTLQVVNDGATVGAIASIDETKSAKIIEPTPDGIFKIWPNPTKNEFQLFNGNENPVKVRVMDLIGRTIEMMENVGIGATVTFGSEYIPGIYFVETYENGSTKVFKLIKQ